MNQLNRYLNNDFFKIGRADNFTTVRNINLAAFTILLLIALNMVFFFIVYATTYYSQLDEIEEVIKVNHK
jgi:hypothetical protein